MRPWSVYVFYLLYIKMVYELVNILEKYFSINRVTYFFKSLKKATVSLLTMFYPCHI